MGIKLRTGVTSSSLSLSCLSHPISVPGGVAVLYVVLRSLHRGARLLRHLRPRRPRQQHPHIAGVINTHNNDKLMSH